MVVCKMLTDQANRLRPIGELAPLAQASQFLFALFEPTDIIEIRLLESWQKDGKKHSRLLERFWMPPGEIIERFSTLGRRNREEHANVYFGVAPRSEQRGTKAAIKRVQCVWADFDNMTPEDAARRWQRILPEPSIVISSGRHGVHAYWLLDTPQDVSSEQARTTFESMLQALYRELGSDSVQDVSRILRLPGLLNCKNAKNGIPPAPCILISCDANRRYPISVIDRRRHGGGSGEDTPEIGALSRESLGQHSYRTRQRIRGLVAYLDQECNDRSRRDFATLCGLIRVGVVNPAELRELVQDKSKFQGNTKYLETSIQRALKAVGH